MKKKPLSFFPNDFMLTKFKDNIHAKNKISGFCSFFLICTIPFASKWQGEGDTVCSQLGFSAQIR